MKKKTDGYHVENLGGIVIQKVQLPHVYTDLSGKEYRVMTWNFRLRIEDGPVLFSRIYGKGTPEDVHVMKTMLVPFISVDNEMEAKHEFYSAVRNFFI